MSNDLEVRQRRQSEGAARRYVESRDPRRYKRAAQEEEIVRGWLRLLPPGALIWDCPCGVGRFVPTAAQMGFRYVGGDYSAEMIGQAKQLASGISAVGFVRADAGVLPLADGAVDCVVLWRLLHHISDAQARLRMLQEAARVSRRMVLVSFHHPLSFTFLRRAVQRLFTGDRAVADITHWQLGHEARSCGLEMMETKSFGKYRSINWFARLKKIHAVESPISKNP